MSALSFRAAYILLMFNQFRLLRNQAFARFFIGNVISLIGWGFSYIAVSWLVLDITGSKLALGELVAVSTLPGLVIALYAGTIIDRMNRKHLLVIIDIYRGIITLSIPILFLIGEFYLWQLYVMSFLAGIGFSIFWPCASAFVQELVPEEDYMSANSLLSASYQSGALIGSALGGFAVYWWGAHTALAIDGITYLVSAALIASAAYIPAGHLKRIEPIWKTFVDGLKFMGQRKMVLFYGFISVLSDVAIWGALAVLTIALSLDILHTGSRGFGLMDGAYGVGALIATVCAVWATGKIKRRNFLLLAYAAAGITCFILPFMPGLVWAMVVFFIMGLHNNSARIVSRTIMMELIPNRVMGRAQTILGVITRLLVIASTLIAGWVAEWTSVKISLQVTSGLFWLSLAGVIITHRLRPNFFSTDQAR